MNRLADATSPYLLQHADNPVDWYPWGAEALERARREDKPILLSIGYSACHWCHVMAHESFADAAIAARMNALFVNIKVDREERPDLDRIYQVAHQLLTRNRGGWPLTMFLTPDDHLPYFGGTYFPPAPRHGLPGFGELLERVAEAWQAHRQDIGAYKNELRQALRQALAARPPGEDLDAELVDRACGQLDQMFDATHGGFGAAPKFPQPHALALLLEAAACAEDPGVRERLLHVVDYSLEAMARGGVYDHLEGGFFRYSVDDSWTIPHFEKMLYDNGPLLELCARRAAATGAPTLRDGALATADWLVSRMTTADGAFCASLDADSPGGEGAYYVWTPDELRTTLGADYAAFAACYGLDGPANFEGRWHLRRAAPGTADGDAVATLAAARQRLREQRAARAAPARDDKVLVSWNALAIRGLAVCARLLERPALDAAASAAVDYLRRVHWRDGRLLAASRDGTAHLAAYLDDHAALLDALLELLVLRWRTADAEFAVDLASAMLNRFADPQVGGFFFTADDHEQLVERVKGYADDALPNGNGLAARGLARLAALLGDARLHAAAEATLRAAQPEVRQHPAACATLVAAQLEALVPAPLVILRVAGGTDVADWRRAAEAAGGGRGQCYVIAADARGLPGLLGERRALDGATVTAYVCHGQVCATPVTTLPAFEAVLAGETPPTG
ncbi:MAG: thioredoxin domain-containing protein [Gammaproteobacteria bacterium]|nr:thioredoxin domain-containing protein [Gammaproteobacteria bacterium]MCP5201426.1 thioredoxin domain-containing protein [Gammaproteobacteria bacterium]